MALPIVRAINTYRGNNCHRKCFNHKNIIEDCGKKFEQIEKSFGDNEISVSDFYRLVNAGELKVCQLPEKQRKAVIVWKKLVETQDCGKDFWDCDFEQKE